MEKKSFRDNFREFMNRDFPVLYLHSETSAVMIWTAYISAFFTVLMGNFVAVCLMTAPSADPDMWAWQISFWILLTCILFCSSCSCEDVLTRKIPNILTYPAIITGAVFALLFDRNLLPDLICFLVIFIAGAMLLGGGDTKMFLATVLFTGWKMFLLAFFISQVFAIGYAFIEGRLMRSEHMDRNCRLRYMFLQTGTFKNICIPCAMSVPLAPCFTLGLITAVMLVSV